jgi:hypothetical protein
MRIYSLIVILALAVLPGCKTVATKSPSANVTTPSGINLQQTGDTKTPATVDATTNKTEIPLPAKSEIQIIQATEKEPQKIVISIPASSVLSSTQTVEHIVGPISVAAPSQIEIAKGQSLKWFYIAGILFGVAALVFVKFQHYKEAGLSVLGAVCVPMLGNFVASEKALWLCIGLVAVVLTLFSAWYLVTHKFDLFPKAKK